MKKIKLITYPNEILRLPSIDITDPKHPDINDLIEKMIIIMNKHNGIGLAAPQVGINKNLIIINTDDGPLPLINPQIIDFSQDKVCGEEGCLSIPTVWGMVDRSQKINLKALSNKGKKLRFDASALFARVIQHEVDHLHGDLFTDKTKNITKGHFNRNLESRKR